MENLSPAAPFTGPLIIDAVATPGGGLIGMMNCPGRCVAPWGRNLDADLRAIKDWRADALLSLIDDDEFERLGVPRFANSAGTRELTWFRLPIADFGIPDARALIIWQRIGPDVLAVLRGRGRVAIHCAAGLGRTGMIAAHLLVALGTEPDTAIAAVRRARPGTIETGSQAAFVRGGSSYSV